MNSQLGIAYLEQQNRIRAKNKLLLALKQDPTIPEPWYSMGYFMETTGHHQEANKYYQKALEVSHGRGDAENNYGTFLCRSGKYKEAVDHFIKAAHDPGYLAPADAYENAGLCAARIAGDNHASDYFTRALAYDSERPASWIALAEINFKHGNYQLAENDLKQFLQVSPPTDKSATLRAKLSTKIKILA
jgi:type IV pilus assembly protein PilF